MDIEHVYLYIQRGLMVLISVLFLQLTMNFAIQQLIVGIAAI